MSTDKTNATRTRKHNRKQENTLVCDEQLDDAVPNTDEHGILVGGRLWSTNNGLAAQFTNRKNNDGDVYVDF